MAGNGGARPGAGRKPKIDELKLIEKLKPYEDIALAQLGKLLKDGNIHAVKLYFEYLYGKPTQVVESTNTHQISNIDLRDLVKFDSGAETE